jgi:hypothetical protein
MCTGEEGPSEECPVWGLIVWDLVEREKGGDFCSRGSGSSVREMKNEEGDRGRRGAQCS